MILGLAQFTPPPNAPPSYQWVFWVIGILFVTVCALIVLLSRKREDVQVTNEKRASAAEGLVKTRDLEIADLKRQVEALTHKNEDLNSENRVIGGIKISELAKFWEEKEKFETEFELTKHELRKSQATLKRIEDGGDIHTTKS